MEKRPGGKISARPLHFIFMTDCSGSMRDNGKIQALNNSIREAIPHMKITAEENPNANVLVRVLKFSNQAEWHVSAPTPVNDFKWFDLKAKGSTALGKALSLIADQLKVDQMENRGLPPVLVLISDGLPTDDWRTGLNEFMAQPWGRKSVRIAIAIGQDADHSVLKDFIGNDEIKPLQANNPEQLVRYIRFVSTAVLKSVSSPKSQMKNSNSSGVNEPIPTPIDMTSESVSAYDVW